MSFIKPTLLASTIAALLVGAPTILAQSVTSPKVIITNTTPAIEVPLQTGSTVEFDAAGDLRVQCRLSNGVCPSVGGTQPPPGDAPSGITLTPSSTTLNQGASLTLTWTSSTNTHACYGVGPAGIGVWSGVALPRTGSVTFVPAVGQHVYQIRCYNAAGSTLQSSAQVTVNESQGGGSNPVASCTEYAASLTSPPPSFTAHGFEMVEKSFVSIFGVNPGSPAASIPVPAFHIGASTSGKYLAIPFVMPANTQIEFLWREPQGMQGVVPGQAYFTVSPCPGDFRPRTHSGGAAVEEWLKSRCGNSGWTNGGFTITTNHAWAGCRVPAGQVLYLNVANYNLSGTTAPATHTCSPSPTCGVSVDLR